MGAARCVRALGMRDCGMQSLNAGTQSLAGLSVRLTDSRTPIQASFAYIALS